MVKLFYSLVFLAAFLLFSVQPMVGKTVLPLIGGAAQGWLIALAFFQLSLLGGYGLVFLTRHWSARRTGVVAAIGMGLAVIGFMLPAPAPQSLDNVYGMIWFLIRWMGWPLLILGGLSPLLQRLFFTQQGRDANPYKLYAISNIGSFAGLFSYPFLIEPFVPLSTQVHVWQGGYVLLAGLLLLASLRVPYAVQHVTQNARTPITAKLFLHWFLLAAVPVSLLSGATAFIATDLGSFPLLWVIPLGLYLATYVVAFSGYDTARLRDVALPAVVLVVGLAAGGHLQGIPVNMAYLYFAMVLGVFTTVALLCHAKAYALRPDGDDLPVFYLALAAGGAFGGFINAFIVPIALSTTIEFYLALAIAVWVLSPKLNLSAPMKKTLMGVCVFAISMAVLPAGYSVNFVVSCAVTLAISLLWLWPRLFLLASVTCLLFYDGFGQRNLILQHNVRNYFGVWYVYDNTEQTMRFLRHGTTLHGTQKLGDDTPLVPQAYYSVQGPVGQALAGKTGDMAVVGLGVGQMACYARQGWNIDFYELDTDVITIAQDWFDYLDQCPARAIIAGDARLTLTQTDKRYDVIALDAFSSDSIPQHLLTAEAMTIYRDKLNDGGILLFHVSNRFMNLAPMLQATAQSIGLEALSLTHKPDAQAEGVYASVWVAIGNARDLAALDDADWVTPNDNGPIWRDDHAPLWPVLNLYRE